MPIYEYQCPSCDTRFERLRPMSAAGQPLDCPSCSKPASQVVSPLAKVTGRGEDEGIGDSDDFSADAGLDGLGHGHGHSHGPGGHTH
jgi:putative FmdB family regulatory protein